MKKKQPKVGDIVMMEKLYSWGTCLISVTETREGITIGHVIDWENETEMEYIHEGPWNSGDGWAFQNRHIIKIVEAA